MADDSNDNIQPYLTGMPIPPPPRTTDAAAPDIGANLPAGTSDQPPGMTAGSVVPSMPGGMTPQMGQPAPSLQGPPQTTPQPPRMGGMPLIAKFLGQMLGDQGSRGYQDMGPGQPARPVSRLNAFEGFLGDFLNAFSQGMAASGHGPGANIRGAAAAIQAPYQQQLQQYGLQQQQQTLQQQRALQQSEIEQRQAQTRMLGEMVTIQTPYGPQTMPYAIAQKAYPAAMQAQARIQSARRYQPTQYGQILDTQTGKTLPMTGSPVGSFVTITPDMQKEFNLPEQLTGKMVKMTELSSWMRGEGSLETVVRGAEDSYLVNKLNNTKTALNVGNANENRLAWAKYGIQKAQFERDTFGQLFGKFGDAYPSLVSLVDPDGNVLGWKSPAAPTSSIKTQAQQAQDLSKLFRDVRTELAQAQAQGKLGPLSGRINEYMTGKIGLDDPMFAKTRALGSLVASGMLKAHFGARGGQEMFGHFESLFNTGRMTIGDLNGALDGFSVFMNQYASRVQTAKPGGGGGATPKSKVQFTPTG